jgi:uncharacterized protein YgfB (UPF0149 family)
MTHSKSDLEILAQQALTDSGNSLTTAELHGATIGIGVADRTRFELQDLVDLLGTDALADGESVSEFVGAALDTLYVDDMSFSPLLPDDDEAMTIRLAALANWCQSFLGGLVAGMHRRGIEDVRSMPEEVKEIVQDFAAIAQLDDQADDDQAGEDESEGDAMELEEYVKVGALLMMSLCNDDVSDDLSEDGADDGADEEGR